MNKRLLHNSFRDLCSILEAMNNMITLQHTEIKTSFETSTHVDEHVFKVTLYKKLLDMVSRYVLNQIVAEFERVNYVGNDNSRYGCIMRTIHSLPCACELTRYVLGSIPLDTIHIQHTKEIEAISNRFQELDVRGKVTLKSKLWKIIYLYLNSICAPPKKKQMSKQQRSTKRDPSYWEYVDALHYVQNNNSSVKQLQLFMVFAYRAILIVDIVHLLKELAQWSDDYMHLLGGIDRYEELKRSLLVYGLSMIYKFYVTKDKWMNITDMGYAIVSRYNVILVSLSLQQSMMLLSLKNGCPLLPAALLSSTHCHNHVKQWSTPYNSRMH
ncbi:hypothetical protein HKD37_17G048439 [Glycine soja]